MAKVLLVDDDELVVYALSRYLSKMGHEVIALGNGAKVMDAIVSDGPDVIVTDIIMPDVEGMEVIFKVRTAYPKMPIIAMSGGSRLVDVSHLQTAKGLGADAILQKPFDESELNRLIQELVA